MLIYLRIKQNQHLHKYSCADFVKFRRINMTWNVVFFLRSIFLGIGLSMDAFSVSLADGLNEPEMRKKKMLAITGAFGLFQGLMPLIGWICVHTIVNLFKSFEIFIPWIALILLMFVGGKMLIDGIRNKEEEVNKRLTPAVLLVQAVATSIDALSVGFSIASYSCVQAVVCTGIIAIVTFVICLIGIKLGKKFGTKFSNKATIIGGIILIVIGLEIFIAGIS
jgi:putative Mn2+ efflux pump MntP